MRYDGIIFDLDGTLWNAIPSTVEGWNSALNELGIDRLIRNEEVEKITGKPPEEGVKILFSDLLQKHPNLKEVLDYREREIITAKGGQLYDGVKEGIESISKNHSLFLVSNCEAWYLDLFFRSSGLKQFFKDWNCYGHSGLTKGKMIKLLKEKYDLQNAVYVGDSIGDLEASRWAEIDFIHAAYGFGKTEGETRSIRHFTELTEVLA